MTVSIAIPTQYTFLCVQGEHFHRKTQYLLIQTNAKFSTYIIQLVYSSILLNEMKEKEVSLSNHTMANDTKN